MISTYLYTVIAAWFLAQLYKFTAKSLKGDIDFRNLYITGGMPSSHSSSVVALVTTIGVLDGINSALFAATLVFAIIVIHDALVLRRSVEEHSLAIGVGDVELKIQSRGHEPKEVVVGSLLGFVVAMTLTYRSWVDNVDFLANAPVLGGWESYAYLATFALALLGTLLAWATLRTKLIYKIDQVRSAVTLNLWIGITILVFGLIISLMQYQGIPVYSARLWSLIILFIYAYFQGWMYFKYYRGISVHIDKKKKVLKKKKAIKKKRRKRAKKRKKRRRR